MRRVIVFATSFLDSPHRSSPSSGVAHTAAYEALERIAERHNLQVDYHCNSISLTPPTPEDLEGQLSSLYRPNFQNV